MQYSKRIECVASYDVVVCGGGFAGFAAAYSAAREGLRVCIVERNGALGGVGTNCLVNHILGQRHIENGKVTTCVGGLFAQLEERLLQMDGAVDFRDIDRELPPQGWLPSLGIGLAFDKEKMQLLLEQLLLEMGVRILYMTTIVDVIKDGDTLTGIVVHNKSGLSVIGGNYFVDATGDADICAYAGCKLLKGDEDGGLAAASLEMHLENVDAAELERIIEWCIELGLPVSFKELGITEVTDEKLMAVATAACAEGDTLHNMPFEVTPEKVCAALKAADAYGRYYLGE